MRYVAECTIIGLLALRWIKGPFTRKFTEGLAIALFTLSVLAGCSTQSAKTIETDKTVRYASDSANDQAEPIITEQRTTKTEESKSEGPSVGLLSGTVHVVGQAIALPFRAVAGLIDVAF